MLLEHGLEYGWGCSFPVTFLGELATAGCQLNESVCDYVVVEGD